MRELLFQKLMISNVVSPARGGELACRTFDGDSWQDVDFATRTRNEFMGREVLLLPDDLTLFRYREFPVDQVESAALGEAIELDAENWSPWSVSEVEIYYLPARSDDHWCVAIWIWNREDRQQLHEGAFQPTHIMPNLAWKIAAADLHALPCVYVEKGDEGASRMVRVSAQGVPEAITVAESEAEADRFWRLLLEQPGPYNVFHEGSLESVATIPQATLHECLFGQPRYIALKSARVEGLLDWTEPLSWYKPAAVLTGLYVAWLVGSGLALQYKSSDVASMVQNARAEASDVLEIRGRVEDLYGRIGQLHALRDKQTQFQRTLASMSELLPKEAWIQAINYDRDDGGYLDITGMASQSGGLAGAIEQMPGVDSATFLSAIQTDQRTNLQTFNMRVKLTPPAGQVEEE